MDVSAIPAGQLIGFEASDGVALSGILYTPRRSSGDVIVFLHGNGDSSVFRSSRTNALADGLTRQGVAFFPFDNRGAGLLRWLKRRNDGETEYLTGGMTHEIIHDCVYDIEGAIRFVRSLGYRRVHLAGHSSGANKIVLYHSLRPRNRISSYALLAPGDDTGLYYRELGPRRFARALDRCKAEIEKGNGDRPAPSGWSPFPISYRSLYDTLNPDGDYNIFPFMEELEDIRLSQKSPFVEFSRIRKRTLIAYGSEDEFCVAGARQCADVLMRKFGAPSKLETVIIEGADHGFRGAHDRLAKELASHVMQK